MAGQSVQKTVQHPSNLDALSHKRFRLVGRHCFDVARKDKVVLQLAGGV